MRSLLCLALGATVIALPAAAQQRTPPGKETVITFAGNGGLRDWQAGPPDSGIVYVRDRNLNWYRVQLTGPCARDRALDTLRYTTDVNGTFDRFSRVSLARYPNQICGVTSIRTSLPPKGQPGAPKVNPPR